MSGRTKRSGCFELAGRHATRQIRSPLPARSALDAEPTRRHCLQPLRRNRFVTRLASSVGPLIQPLDCFINLVKSILQLLSSRSPFTSPCGDLAGVKNCTRTRPLALNQPQIGQFFEQPGSFFHEQGTVCFGFNTLGHEARIPRVIWFSRTARSCPNTGRRLRTMERLPVDPRTKLAASAGHRTWVAGVARMDRQAAPEGPPELGGLQTPSSFQLRPGSDSSLLTKRCLHFD